jgi:hypothetical protein
MIFLKFFGTPNRSMRQEKKEAERPLTFEVSKERLANLPTYQRHYPV